MFKTLKMTNRLTQRLMVTTLYLGIATSTLFLSPNAAQADSNLVKNGNFSNTQDGKPVDWRVIGSNTSVSYDTMEKPEGASGSLKVTIDAAGKGQGQILQKIPVTPGQIYFLEGWVKSGKAENGFLQIKLLKNNKEITRISARESGVEWNRVTKEFDVGEADAIAILLRFYQTKKNIGKSLWFSNVSVIPASERIRTPPEFAKLEAVPTFNSIGIYADITGEMSKFTTGKIVFRKKGKAEWRPALDMVWHDVTKQLRGSLLNLEEDTEYEIKASMEDPNLKDPVAPAMTTAQTWKSDVPIARTIHLPPGVSNEPLIIDQSGTKDGWVRYTTDPSSPSILNAEKNGENAILLKGVHHVIIEGLTIKGGIKDAIKINESTDIRIRRCDISQWGQVGELLPSTNKKWGKGPFYMDEEGNRINLQAGVRITAGAARVVVEDCFIHNPRGRATSWKNGHPLGPTSIIMSMSDGNHVIRNNDLIGGEDHRFNDTIEAAYNNKVQGGPYRDTDIAGNIMFFSNDDGIELDGGQMNIRMFNNWIESSYCGISTAPTLYGPSYIYRNLIVLEGEERGETNFALKIGGNKKENPGQNFFFHNTIYSNGKALRGGNWGKGPTPVQTRNNLFALGEILYPQVSYGDFDYDMLRPNSLDPALPKWQKNGVIGSEKFQNRSAGDYRLTDQSPAIDAGQILPTVNDNHTGKEPDIGAIPFGAESLFPVRPNSISLLPMRVHLAMTIGHAETASATIAINAPASTGSRWRIITDTPWLIVSPTSGPCDGNPHEVTLSIDPANKKEGLLQGAVTVRTDSGYNRTSFIKARVRPQKLFMKVFDAVDLEHSGFTVVESNDAPTPSFLQAPESRSEADKSFIKVNVSIDQPGTYYLHGLISVPGPGAPAHDSFFVQIDEGERTLWAFAIKAASHWAWQTSSIHKEAYPQKIELDAGEHTIMVWGREALSQVAKLAISNSTLSPES
ncbi:carbohydrate binding domain-containing protein [Rubellicoccus peritrichatus]|uniref:Right-handed parallel beta-helix repeat-containing protein n=1 Tax=Rubellicoccus peritrichatus TaxID=3080537 RepID=A0AAQ3LJC8_9BACT|nr:right-handed parallel beta-helix repeat-containing protein [Puniceicoccus sp. CR14]WOO43264.1 right-handed parallel beta-helix repeat-containing protein [Puniceicoccus sp. CR14]